MEQTLKVFRMKQAEVLALLHRLQAFLDEGDAAGVEVDSALKDKLKAALASLGETKLRVALVGGFSEGKTAIAAAWLEQLDRQSMHISHKESSNEVKVYEVGGDLALIDTPGLFGFGEAVQTEEGVVEKYKDITRKYVSEAHLVLYVMDPMNPIKESHRDELHWFFRTLNLLPRTVFVLSRFDEVADVEDDAEYNEMLQVKRENVSARLRDLIELSQDELQALSIVAVSANPFERGIDHWLNDIQRFRELSRISLLQDATSHKVAGLGGATAVLAEAKRSIVLDVLSKQMPIAAEFEGRVQAELNNLQQASVRLDAELQRAGEDVASAVVGLRTFVAEHFTDLILRAKGADMESVGEFFEREIGEGGVMLETKLRNAFEEELGPVNLRLNALGGAVEAEVSHFNTQFTTYAKRGTEFLMKGGFVNAKSVIAVRDGVKSVGKVMRLDLSSVLKFKPWGAVKFAKGVNVAMPLILVAIEAWDSWDTHKKVKAFKESMDALVQNLASQRAELLELVNSDSFSSDTFPGYAELQAALGDLQQQIDERRAWLNRLSAWRSQGEEISVELARL